MPLNQTKAQPGTWLGHYLKNNYRPVYFRSTQECIARKMLIGSLGNRSWSEVVQAPINESFPGG
jgi:hypothetical protein